MPNFNPRIERLKAMLGLEEKRGALQHQLDTLHEQLSALKDQLFDESPSAPTKTSTNGLTSSKGNKKGRNKRGALKEQIVAALSSAGNAGVRVTELAAVLGTKAANIHAWFHSTGKKVPGLKKISGGHYRLNGGEPSTKAALSSPAKASTKGKTSERKNRGVKRGELSENIFRALGSAGDKGLKIKELADKVGANYRNVSVWFVTTGKKFPKVKKVGPAHYKLTS
jgi:hypothetical protein